MTLLIEKEYEGEIAVDCTHYANLVAEKVLDMEGCPYETQINLVLTDNQEIQRVNREFRSIDAPTDVLSFPMVPFETPGDYGILDEDDSYFDLDHRTPEEAKVMEDKQSRALEELGISR